MGPNVGYANYSRGYTHAAFLRFADQGAVDAFMANPNRKDFIANHVMPIVDQDATLIVDVVT